MIDDNLKFEYFFIIYKIYNIDEKKKIIDSIKNLPGEIKASFPLLLEDKLWEKFKKKKDLFLNKEDFLEIIYSYNLAPDQVLKKDEDSFLKISSIFSKKHRLVVVPQSPSKMKREELSFVPTLNEMSKIRLVLSFFFWSSLYFILLYFKVIESIVE